MFVLVPTFIENLSMPWHVTQHVTSICFKPLKYTSVCFCTHNNQHPFSHNTMGWFMINTESQVCPFMHLPTVPLTASLNKSLQSTRCIRRGPGRERIVCVVPGGKEIEPRVKTEFGRPHTQQYSPRQVYDNLALYKHGSSPFWGAV
jgi:hypothetical protein